MGLFLILSIFYFLFLRFRFESFYSSKFLGQVWVTFKNLCFAKVNNFCLVEILGSGQEFERWEGNEDGFHGDGEPLLREKHIEDL